QLLRDYRARVQSGARVRLVVKEQHGTPGVLRTEIAIKPVTLDEDGDREVAAALSIAETGGPVPALVERECAPAPRRPDPLGSVEFIAFKELLHSFEKSGQPAQGTPVSESRFAAFVALRDLMQLLQDYRHCVRCGKRVRLVVKEQPRILDVMRT